MATSCSALPRFKRIKLQGIEGRLSVLQQERTCVQAVSSMDDLKSCEQASRQGMRQVEDKQKAGWESLKASQGKDQKGK
jgi:hypothetical protein